VDIRLPPTFRDEGLRAALELRRTAPDTAILILSQYVEHTYAAELLAQAGGGGGVGYLLKDRVLDISAFVDAVRPAADGDTALDPEGVAQLLGNRGAQRLDVLTPRELDVLKLMAEGRSNTAIADALVLSVGASREAHREHLPEAPAASVGERPPPGARGARLSQEQ
jgi:DNA-binding NarL/FixJ family response regulator